MFYQPLECYKRRTVLRNVCKITFKDTILSNKTSAPYYFQLWLVSVKPRADQVRASVNDRVHPPYGTINHA